MKYNLLIFLSLLCFSMTEAQNNTASTSGKEFKMEVNIPSQKGKKLYLGQYFKDATYAIDSTYLSADGKATLSLSKVPEQGQYFLYVKPSFQLDLLIGENQNDIRLYIDETDFSKSTVSGSNDTELLWKYLSEVQKFDADITETEEQLSGSAITEQTRTELETQLKLLEEKKRNFTNASIIKHDKEWFGIFIKGLEPITLPYPNPKDEKEYIKNKEYGKAHYFDNINLTDPRFWRTNYFLSQINTYMRQWVDQIPDSLAVAASRLVAKTKSNEFCFKEMLSELTNESIKSNVMGDENIWARLYEDYIAKKNVSWIDSTKYSELGRMYEIVKNNRLGAKAHNLTLKTMDGKTINTNSIDAAYTILYFYDPSCTHCKTETPKLHNELYKKYKDKGVEIVAINIGSNKEEWERFVNDNKLTDWINSSDPDHKSSYWMYYDTSGIPAVFVLNKNKVIVAKKINEESLEKFFNYQYK